MQRGVKRSYRYFVADFETTVWDGQPLTEVWAAAIVELYTENVRVFHSIEAFWEYCLKLGSNCIIYFHNLKFDGSFLMDYFLITRHYKQAYNEETGFPKDSDMPWGSLKYLISDMGQWYSLTVKTGGHIFEFRDSYKLLPFALRKIGKDFKTKHHKTEIEYTGYRYAGCEITVIEEDYIKNDVLVIKEALEECYNQGHSKMTIGSCCLAEYKKIVGKEYDTLFPDIYGMETGVDSEPDAGKWVRKTYKGAWCYVNPRYQRQVIQGGCTGDVNSLYPSVMHSSSGNRYPIGKPRFWEGDYIPNWAKGEDKYYFVHIRTRFYLKADYLPFIQIKNNFHYKGTEALKTSDIYNSKTERFDPYYIDRNGNMQPALVDLYLTMTDYELIKEHYILIDFCIVDGCAFYAQTGIFDKYIDKYMKIKEVSQGAVRTLAKLFLNNLYGKMAASPDSSYKLAYVEENMVKYTIVQEHDKKPGYIPVGSAITSYAREFTIRHAQMNYEYFIYADTDSLHMTCSVEQVKGLKIHPTALSCWKMESYWDLGYFTRQKTYIEHITHENGEPVKPYYNVTCAGMPDKSKKYFISGLNGFSIGKKRINTQQIKSIELDEKLKRELKLKIIYRKIKRQIDDFDIGLELPGKLLPKHIPGGIVLVDTNYVLRP